MGNLQLLQIIPGTDISCTYDGRASDMTPQIDPGDAGYPEGTISQQAPIHAVMNMLQHPDLHHRGTTQHVFELAPTTPLSHSETPASSSAPVYDFQNSPPPYKPELPGSLQADSEKDMKK